MSPISKECKFFSKIDVKCDDIYEKDINKTTDYIRDILLLKFRCISPHLGGIYYSSYNKGNYVINWSFYNSDFSYKRCTIDEIDEVIEEINEEKRQKELQKQLEQFKKDNRVKYIPLENKKYV